jgi:hypothetical protein
LRTRLIQPAVAGLATTLALVAGLAAGTEIAQANTTTPERAISITESAHKLSSTYNCDQIDPKTCI